MSTHLESGSVTHTVSDQASLGDIIELGLAPGGTWQQNNLTAITGAPPAASVPGVADTLFAYVAPDGSGRVVYRDGDINGTGDVIELWLEPGSGTWQWDSLTAITGAPQAALAPVAFVTPDGAARVLYQSSGGLTQLWLAPGAGTWQQDSLTAMTGAPGPAFGPFAYVTPDNVARVVYSDGNSDIIELRLASDAGTWQQADLTAITGAPPAAGQPFAYVTPDGAARVVYRSFPPFAPPPPGQPSPPLRVDIIELLLTSDAGTWQENNLTATTGAPQPATAPVALTGPDGLPRVYYATQSNGHIIELRLDPDGWIYADLNISVSNPPAPPASRSPFAYVTPDGALRVLYLDSNSDIIEMYLTSDAGTWQWDTLTAVPGAPPAAAPGARVPFAYVTPDKVARVYYSSLPS